MPNYKKYINPLFEEIENIKNFSKVKKDTKLLKEEYPYLEKTTQILINKILNDYSKLEELNEQLEKIIKQIESTTGDDKEDAVTTYNQMFLKLEDDIEKINRRLSILNSPYFGKIFFQRKKDKDFSKKDVTTYIGKFGIFDTEIQKILVTDWRAPIANLYYQNSGPADSVSFNGPTGIQKGNLIQKRQFEINRARLNSIYDAKTGTISADEFLIAQLEARVASKLTDIVATIQKQQNEIIRENIDKPIIIQGVAGSGKTTILLHKIAYLLFTYPKKINPKNSIIIAPNKMFLDYISDVLPSLGIEHLEYNTFLFWSKKVLGWDDRYVISVEKDNLNVKKFKGSYKFKLLLEEYFESFEEDLLENIPNTLKYEIADRYYDLKQRYSEISMTERIELSIDYATAQKQYRKNLKEGFVAPIESMDKKIKDVKEYFKRKMNVYKIYKNMFDYIKENDYLDKELLNEIKKYNKKTIYFEKGYYYYKTEDLPPLLWLHFQFYGYKDYTKDYVLVDEAQDLSPFQILILKQISKNNNLTLAGDLAQAIVPPFHIKTWDDIIEVLRKDDEELKEISLHELHRCYRTTIEIINFTNEIFKKYFTKEFKLPEAVLRHGEEVEFVECENPEGLENLIKIINKEFDKDISNLAVICKDIAHANTMFARLKEKQSQIRRNVMSHNENNYESGLLVLPVEKAKGLEFDTVIIAEMTDKHYKVNELDIKLLNVGMTRALHKLYIHTIKSAKGSELLES
jgi:DNA helicase II / ATP-dependent DNA helicase PcrA